MSNSKTEQPSKELLAAIKEGEKTHQRPECQNVFDTARTLGRFGHLSLNFSFLTKIIHF